MRYGNTELLVGNVFRFIKMFSPAVVVVVGVVVVIVVIIIITIIIIVITL